MNEEEFSADLRGKRDLNKERKKPSCRFDFSLIGVIPRKSAASFLTT